MVIFDPPLFLDSPITDELIDGRVDGADAATDWPAMVALDGQA
jgi:hypothetical protein